MRKPATFRPGDGNTVCGVVTDELTDADDVVFVDHDGRALRPADLPHGALYFAASSELADDVRTVVEAAARAGFRVGIEYRPARW